MVDSIKSGAFARRQRWPFVVAVDSTRMPMAFVDAIETTKPIVYVNDAFLALTGYQRANILRRPFDTLLVKKEPNIETLVAQAGGDTDTDVCCCRCDGESFWANVLISPVIDSHRVTTHYFVSFVDLTRHIEERSKILALSADVERKAVEVRILQTSMIAASRLSAMGMIGATIAHELNQPLSAITNYLRGVRRQVEASNTPVPDSVIDALKRADQSAMRASHIIRRVREASQRKLGSEKAENLRSLIVEARDLALLDAPLSGVVTSLNFDDDTSVLVDRVEIQQVIINLIHNATDALTGQACRKIFISAAVRPDNFCEISVRDTGPGIAEAALSSLFEPFKTTKPNGVGIGLSISRTIIEAHGGEFWLASSSCNGADFRFSLRLASNQAGARRELARSG